MTRTWTSSRTPTRPRISEFPHESTNDQFFAEDQFESYRKLGQHIAAVTFRGAEDCVNVTAISKLANINWVADGATEPARSSSGREALTAMWDRMRANPGLGHLFRELHGLGPVRRKSPHCGSKDDERVVCLEPLELLERHLPAAAARRALARTRTTAAGWTLFTDVGAQPGCSARCGASYQHVFGIRFGYFCRQRLGLA